VATRLLRGTSIDIGTSYPRHHSKTARAALLFAPHRAGYASRMFGAHLRKIGLRGWHVHGASLASIWLCLGLWIRAKTVDQSSRANAERRALFVGLWPPMLWLIGDSVERAKR
jgi:hypothetical protein